MADQWLCLIEGQEVGPISFAELQQLAGIGKIKPTDRVRLQSQPGWILAWEVPDLLPIRVTSDASESYRRESPPEKSRASASLAHTETTSEPAPPPPPISIPVGIAVASSIDEPPLPSRTNDVRPSIPNFAVENTTPSKSFDRRRENKSARLALLIGAGIAVAVLAVLMVLVVNGTLRSKDVVEQKSKVPAERVAAAEEPSEEVDPTPKPTLRTNSKNPTSEPQELANSSDAALLKTVTRWNDISRVRSLGLRGMPASLDVQGLWLAEDLQGTPFTAAAAKGQEAKGLYLFVRFAVKNAIGAAPLDYHSYRNSAVLFDDQGRGTRPIVVEEKNKQRIEAGESLEDTLVFPLASREFETFRLALPHAAIGIKDSRSFGLELPRAAIGKGLTSIAGVNGKIDTQGQTPDQASADTPQPIPEQKPDDFKSMIEALEAKAEALDKMDKK